MNHEDSILMGFILFQVQLTLNILPYTSAVPIV